MVTAKQKKSDKPKKPVGRPRKKLGTRVTDVPLVSALRPRASRSNADSAAIQRAKLAFRRDYPIATGKRAFDEYKTRALLDAMADPSRGAIGSRVLGPSAYKTEKKQAELDAAIQANQPFLIQNGRILLNKKAVRAALSTAAPAAAPVPVGPSVTLIPVPAGPSTIPAFTEGTSRTKQNSPKTRSRKRRMARAAREQGIAYGAENQRALEELELLRSSKKRKERDEGGPGPVTLERQTPYERELSNIRTTLRGDLDPADRLSLVGRMRELRRQVDANEAVDITPLDEPSTHRPPTPAQERQAARIVRKFTAKQLTEAAARIKAASAIDDIKKASPAVAQEVQRKMGNLMTEEPELVQEYPEALSAFQEMADAANAETRRRLDEEEARQYGRHRPTTEQQEANQQAAATVAAMLRAESEAPPPSIRIAPAGPIGPVIDVGKEARENAARIAVERKARRAKQLEAAQAKVDRAEEADRRAIANQAVLEEAALANDAETRRSSAVSIQSAIKRALAQNQYNKSKDAATTLQAAARSAITRDALNQAIESQAQQDAATTLQAAVRSALTRDALNQAAESQAQQDAAIRVIQRAVRDKVDGVAKQKRIVSKIQEMNTRVVPPRPRPSPSMTQPSIRYEDPIDEVDLTDEFDREDDAVRQLQAALRRFSDRSHFSNARELEAEYAAQDEIGVPGADIRPNNRVIPAPPPLPPRRPTPLLEAVLDAIDEVEAGPLGNKNTPKSGFVRQGLSEKGLREAAKRLRPFEGTQQRITDLAPGLGAINERMLRERASSLKRVVKEEDIRPVVDNLVANVLADAVRAKFANTRQEEDDSSDDGFDGNGLVGGVIRRLRGLGYFNSLDNYMQPGPSGTPIDSLKLLREARGGRMNDDRTDFRVLMDAMKTIRRAPGDPNGGVRGGAMGGGRVFLSGVSAPTGGSQYTLHEITFPDKEWKTSSSLRWLRSNGIKPMKKASHSGSVYKYMIASSKGFTDHYTSELVSRGRKIIMMYGKA
jgi:hypothetical protein